MPPAPSTSAPPLKENIKKAYDSIASNYNEWTKPTHPIRIKHLNKLLDRLPDPKEGDDALAVLEVGCGGGEPVTSLLASATTGPVSGSEIGKPKPRFRVFANDISTAQLEAAAARLSAFKENVEFRGGDMMGLSFEKGSLDAVIGMYSIIHLPREEQTVFLERVYGWLKPGGFFLGNFGVGELESGFNEDWLGCGRKGNGDGDGERGVMFWSGWGGEKTCEILAGIGFEVVSREVVVDVEEDNGVEMEVPFMWVLARKGGTRD
ncbi:class I SAM-dependent methyltransferase [Aspergillus lucknowensis]|uniref:S-adenosyl-L-methionine-dependent methyltransferase n=1 Tax=Aspergillus lucknowensis TaxID=176173 RepID=A0ABR4LGN3_9EURO